MYLELLNHEKMYNATPTVSRRQEEIIAKIEQLKNSRRVNIYFLDF